LVDLHSKDKRHRRIDPHPVNSSRSASSPFLALALLFACLLSAQSRSSAQAVPLNPAAPLPNAPLPVIKHEKSKTGPCRVIPKSESYGAAITATAGGIAVSSARVRLSPAMARLYADNPSPENPAELPSCSPPPLINWYNRFINGPDVRALTPKEKARLAVRNLLDPFNAVTILGNAAITIGANSHSDYGPGMPGFARYVGVSYSEDMTGEFFGTFLIPSVMHQAPHYHRLPNASIPHRIRHAILQVAWTQGDNGEGMPNYANILGFGIEDEIANLYVPGRETNAEASASRYAIGFGLAPIDNFITEFLPDVAKHIHVRVVIVQRIINQVARTEGPGGA
jgi:hypothetical protein